MKKQLQCIHMLPKNDNFWENKTQKWHKVYPTGEGHAYLRALQQKIEASNKRGSFFLLSIFYWKQNGFPEIKA